MNAIGPLRAWVAGLDSVPIRCKPLEPPKKPLIPAKAGTQAFFALSLDARSEVDPDGSVALDLSAENLTMRGASV
jgi:hypothetical protein